jgi:hypothetical protein
MCAARADWIHLDQDRGHWRVDVNMVVKLSYSVKYRVFIG